MTNSQSFIQAYYKKLETGPDYFNVDSALMKKEDFENKEFKVLLILPTPALTKSVSATVNVINDTFIQMFPKAFLDIAYLPTKKDIEVFDSANMPYAIGHITHLDPSHFDVVGFSISVLHEVLTVPTMIKSFSRCDKPIPLTWTERKDTVLGTHPLMICGGITATCGDVLFGELGDGRQAFLDAMLLGIDETFEGLYEHVIGAKNNPAGLPTNQEIIEGCLQYSYFYHPQAYRVRYEDNLIVENTKINPKAQDFVYPLYPKELSDRVGVGRTIIQGTGTNAGNTSIQFSEGCTGGLGSCFFCAEGNYSGAWVEQSLEVIKKHALETKKYCAAGTCKPLTFNANHMKDFSEVIHTLNAQFPKVTYINMRLEELVQSQDSFKMMKYCLTREALTPIPGRGLVRQDDLTIGPVLGYKEAWIQNTHPMPTSDGIRVTTKQGIEITGTPNHPLMTQWTESHQDCDYTTLESLKLGDTVLIGLGSNVYGDNKSIKLGREVELSKGFAALCGWYMGDGYCSIKPTHGSYVFGCCFHKDEEDLSMYLKYVLEEENLNVLDHSIANKNKVNWRVSSKEFVLSFAEKFGKTSRGKKIPKEILEAPEQVQREFIRHWFAADGTVQKELRGATRVTLCSVNKQALLDLQAMLINMGVLSSVRGNKTKSQTKDSWTWCLDINKEYLELFNEKVGIAGKKGLKVKVCKGNPQTLVALRVKAIEKVEDIQTFAVSIPETQSYLTNGVYSHNTGASRLSAPIEGLSARIRQGFMNKNLSSDSIRKMMTFMIGQRVTDIKVGLVWTCHETEEDWKEIRELVKELKVEAASLNRKLPFRLKATALVYYPMTPLEYTERKTSRVSFLGERYFTNEMYEANKEAGIHIKINGFRGSTFIEQSVVDLGRSLTPWLFKYLVTPGIVCFNMRPIADEKIFPTFKALITNQEKYFGARDVDSYISPAHRIRPALEGGILYGARKLQENQFSTEPTGKCLYTYDGCSTKCAKGRIKKKPYLKYKDVQLKEGHMIGSDYEVIDGCDYCETPQEVKCNHTKRDWSSKFSVDDLQAQVVTRSQVKYRFIFQRNKDYAILNPHNTAYNSIAAVLRQDDKILGAYWELVDHSMFHQMDAELVYEISGLQIIDCVFKEEMDDLLKASIKKANLELKSGKFLDVHQIQMGEKLSVNNDYNVFRFKTKGIPLEAFITGSLSYKNTVRVLSMTEMQAKVVVQTDKRVRYPVYKQVIGGVEGVFALPRRYNPYLFFQEVLSEKKITQKALQQQVEFSVVAVLQEDSYTYCKCGNGSARSAITGKALGKCVHCAVKLLATK